MGPDRPGAAGRQVSGLTCTPGPGPHALGSTGTKDSRGDIVLLPTAAHRSWAYTVHTCSWEHACLGRRRIPVRLRGARFDRPRSRGPTARAAARHAGDCWFESSRIIPPGGPCRRQGLPGDAALGSRRRAVTGRVPRSITPRSRTSTSSSPTAPAGHTCASMPDGPAAKELACAPVAPEDVAPAEGHYLPRHAVEPRQLHQIRHPHPNRHRHERLFSGDTAKPVAGDNPRPSVYETAARCLPHSTGRRQKNWRRRGFLPAPQRF